MNEAPQPQRSRNWWGILGTTFACVVILSTATAAIVVINRTEPTAEQVTATRKSAALVETLKIERSTYTPNIVVLGTVEPAEEVFLSPRVSGQVVDISPSFVPGGVVRKDELLLRIDPADFENALKISESELEQAEASLEIERGRQALAEKELTLLQGTIDDTNRALVLREPQIDSIQAEINSAKASVERANLDLERTRVHAPFDAQILSRSVNVGSQVSPGDELAQLVGIEEYWIMASVPVRNLHWIEFPEQDGQGSEATLQSSGTWPPGARRYASVSRLIGSLDERSRLARVLLTVDDPLARDSDAPPLILGSLIETRIDGRPIEDVVRLGRELVRENDTVWIMKDGKLDIRQAEIIFRDADYAYVRDGLNEGEDVVTTTLATVADGVRLRKLNASAPVYPNSAREGGAE